MYCTPSLPLVFLFGIPENFPLPITSRGHCCLTLRFGVERSPKQNNVIDVFSSGLEDRFTRCLWVEHELYRPMRNVVTFVTWTNVNSHWLNFTSCTTRAYSKWYNHGARQDINMNSNDASTVFHHTVGLQHGRRHAYMHNNKINLTKIQENDNLNHTVVFTSNKCNVGCCIHE